MKRIASVLLVQALATASAFAQSEPPVCPNVGNVTLVLPEFLNLSASDGLLLSAAIVGVWAAAFAVRAAIRALGGHHDGEGN